MGGGKFSNSKETCSFKMRSHYVSVQLENQVKGLKDSETTKENASG